MMITRNYQRTELQPLERTDRHRPILEAALGIYRNSILPEAQNPERQILYWIDHSEATPEDEFRCFAVRSGKEVTGYLQYSYFGEEHIFFFEYLCLRSPKDGGLVPSKAVKTIEDYLAQHYRAGSTIVFEVAQTRKGVEWRRDTKLINYFKRLGFRTVDFAYRYPILQSYDGDLSYPADLMVRLPEGRTVVTASEMRTILRSIYFKHYLRWDRPFLDPIRFAERERLINLLYAEQVNRIGESQTFDTQGDPRRSAVTRLKNKRPQLRNALKRVFGPKLARVAIVIGALAFTQGAFGTGWQLMLLIPLVSIAYCLVDDTEAALQLASALNVRIKTREQPRG